MLTDKIIEEIKEHARATNPHECCGLVVLFKGRLKYIKCNNLLSNDMFCIDPVDYANAEDMGTIVFIVHSHVHIDSSPSDIDVVSCDRGTIPWLIYSIKTDTYNILYPKEFLEPLIGRPFLHGVMDCYSLIIDYYKQELNIKLNDYIREPEWWLNGKDLYVDNYHKEGFILVDDLKPHDIVLIQNGGEKINHGAIYIGDSMILHHTPNRLSSRDVYGGYWRKHTRCIIRHESLL